MIKFFTDGTVTDLVDTVNSTHADKAQSALLRACAKAVAYKGAMAAVKVEATFDPGTASIQWDGQVITPDNYESVTQPDVKAFATAVYTFNDGEQRKVYEALQAKIIEPERELQPLTLEQERALAEKQIKDKYKATMDAITAEYTQQEINTFFQKAREAVKVLTGVTEGTPFIDRFAEKTGKSREEVAKAIQSKEAPWAIAAADAEAEMEQALDALKA